jgi:hypothetical protein
MFVSCISRKLTGPVLNLQNTNYPNYPQKLALTDHDSDDFIHGTVVRLVVSNLTSNIFFFLFFFVLYVDLKLSDDFFKKKKKTRLKILPVLTRKHYTSLMHWV